MTPTFFKTPAAFRAWLAKNHVSKKELLVGFYKTSSGKPSITYQGALDEALAVGWIDGVRRGIDAVSYTIRFTPRKPRSIWSNVNIKRVGELQAVGRMLPAGLAAFERRDAKRSGVYSYERETAAFAADELEAFKRDNAAWVYFESQPPSYRRVATFWVANVKKAETRARRFGILVEYSRKGERIPPLAPRRKG